MQSALLVIQSGLGIFLVIAILLQARGAGFGPTWRGGGETYHTRRGLEKILFYATVIGIAVFAVVSVLVLR